MCFSDSKDSLKGTFLFYVVVVGGYAISRCAQNLLLTLCSGIIPGCAQVDICSTGIERGPVA